MQALILVGGEGARLRPLTRTTPKPIVRLVDRPFMAYMVEWLIGHGVDDILFACGVDHEETLRSLGGEFADRVKVDCVVESEPLGTAGPIRLAADQGLLAEHFLMLNGDLLTDLDLGALVSTREPGSLIADEGSGGGASVGDPDHALATIGLYPVADPSAFGLVRRDGGPPAPGAAPVANGGAVREFLEKPDPGAIDTDEVNAGIYLLNRGIEAFVPEGRSSIERDVFPVLAERVRLQSVRLEGYWKDIGTPERYLEATWDILEGRLRAGVWQRLHDAGGVIVEGVEMEGNVAVEAPALVEPGCEIAGGSVIGPRAVIGTGSHIGERVTITGSVLHPDCEIGSGASITGAILAAGVGVGAGAHIGSGAVIGEKAHIEAGARVDSDARIEPGEVVAAA